MALLVSAVGTALALPGPAAGAPTTDALDRATVWVVSRAAGRLDLFTRGSDNALHWKTYANGVWTGWNDLGGNLTSAPAAVS